MLGNEALATRTYVVNIVMFVYLFAIAMAHGGAICIGHLVGERKIQDVYKRQVASKSVTEASKGALRPSGNRP